MANFHPAIGRDRRRADRPFRRPAVAVDRPHRRCQRHLRRPAQSGSADKGWRIAFIAGLILAPLLAGWIGHRMPTPQLPASWIVIIAAGLLVGFGAQLGRGCTSGHGICGVARLSPRSIAATAIFMLTAIATVAITRHVLGG